MRMEYTNELLLTKRKKGDMLCRFVRGNKILFLCVLGIIVFSGINLYLMYRFLELIKML